MKNLANCTPREFLRQSNRIRKSVENWLKLTNVMGIRQRMPDLKDITDEAERKRLVSEQMRANLSSILDAALDEHPDETAEILALVCFVEPEDIDNYKITDFLGAISEILNSSEVIGFFTSLVNLGQTLGS